MNDRIDNLDPASAIRQRFASFNVADFVNWLRSGFLAYHSPREGDNQPFSFACFYISRLDSIVDDLGYIYRELVPLEQQPLFRSAIGALLLRDVADEELPERAISDLLYLIAEIFAFESLECLPVTINERRYTDSMPWLQYESISVLKQLLPAREALEGLRSLVTSASFNCRFTFDILTSLCRHDPENWIEHVALLSDSIDVSYQQAAQGGQETVLEVWRAEMRFQDVFAEFVPTATILDCIKENEEKLSQGSAYEHCVDLFRQLSMRDNSPAYVRSAFSHTNDECSITLALVAERSRQVSISISDEYYFRLFKRPLEIRNHITLFPQHQQDRVFSIDDNLRIRPREDFRAEAALAGVL